MTIGKHSFSAQPAGVSIGATREALGAILDPHCAAAIWPRAMPGNVQAWLDALDPDLLPRGRVILPAGTVADTVAHLCDASGLPEGAERDWLETDITVSAEMFATLMQSTYLRLRLDVVTSNACRKFHVDAISARLICTYRGTGTQYGTPENGTDPRQVFTVPTGAPILLRGTLWRPEHDTGLLHRSPPIEGTNETRFVLVLDPVSDPDNEL